MIIFQATLPKVGAGALPAAPPSETDFYDTDKEKSLHAPRSTDWISVAEECAEEGLGVSMFLAPNKYMDTGSVCVVPNVTAGEVFWHPRFMPERDGFIMQGQLARLVARMQGFNCMARVRCSQGMYPVTISHLSWNTMNHQAISSSLVIAFCRPPSQRPLWIVLPLRTRRTYYGQPLRRQRVYR